MDFILWALAISIGLNLLLFVPAYYFKTDKLTDLSYAITFIVLTIAGFFHSSKAPAQVIAAVMVLLWAIRLGGFLFIRIRKMKKDSRFDQMRNDPLKFGKFWFFQGLTVFVVMASALALWDTSLPTVGLLSYVGWIIFGFGLALEGIADYQKYRFNNAKTKDVWIDTGFWRISRHPNYLGEIMVWLGVYIFCFAGLSWLARLLCLASPLYIAAILLFFSGIPLLEKAADKKWGNDPEYKKYKKDVPVLIPTASSIKRLG